MSSSVEFLFRGRTKSSRIKFTLWNHYRELESSARRDSLPYTHAMRSVFSALAQQIRSRPLVSPKFPRVPQKVGMSRGSGISFLFSWFAGFLVSCLFGVLVSWFLGFKLSGCIGCLVSLLCWFLGFSVPKFLGFKVSKIQKLHIIFVERD